MRTPLRLIQGSQLTTSAVAYYTAPTNTKTTISAMTVTNTSGVARTVTIYLVPNAGTAGVGNVVLNSKSLSPNETFNVTSAIGQTLEAGGTIQALSDAATAITLVASGYEQT